MWGAARGPAMRRPLGCADIRACEKGCQGAGLTLTGLRFLARISVAGGASLGIVLVLRSGAAAPHPVRGDTPGPPFF